MLFLSFRHFTKFTLSCPFLINRITRNRDFNYYTGQEGDYANFLSQCLMAGGQDLSRSIVDDRGFVINIGTLEESLLSKGWNNGI